MLFLFNGNLNKELNVLIIIYVVFFMLLLFGCNENIPQLTIKEQYIIGEPITLLANGLNPGNAYSISAHKKDEYGRLWHSQASFTASQSGQIDVSHQKPAEGDYNIIDPYGLLWSMTMEVLPEDWVAPTPKDFAEIKFILFENSDTLKIVSTKQWIIPESVEYEVLSNNIEAEVFRKSNSSGKHPAIMFLGGSGGGLSWARRQAAYFANKGFVTMALAYFNMGELPKHLAQIPLEYVENAIDYLKEQKDVDTNSIGILGYSKGAELALLIASQRSDINCVAAIAPGSALFQGFKPPKYPVISSWTKDGNDLPFVPNAYDKKFFKTYDGMYLWYRTLAQHKKFEAAVISVEKINGDILLISGVKDKIWPATFMAEQIITRLHINEFPHNYNHLAFPNAGHGIAEPPGQPTTTVSKRLGGTPTGNAYAREMGWKEVEKFFNKNLK